MKLNDHPHNSITARTTGGPAGPEVVTRPTAGDGAPRGEQLELAYHAPPPEVAPDERGTWTYRRGMPDRAGVAKYLHLVMWKHDPKESRARGAEARKTGARGVDWQSKVATEEQARASIVALLESDRQPRTFNCMCMQLHGSGASGFLETPTEAALWGLVAEGRLWWACEEDCVFFALAEHIEIDAEAA